MNRIEEILKNKLNYWITATELSPNKDTELEISYDSETLDELVKELSQRESEVLREFVKYLESDKSLYQFGKGRLSKDLEQFIKERDKK